MTEYFVKSLKAHLKALLLWHVYSDCSETVKFIVVESIDHR
jgi:hypothetical protein